MNGISRNHDRRQAPGCSGPIFMCIYYNFPYSVWWSVSSFLTSGRYDGDKPIELNT